MSLTESVTVFLLGCLIGFGFGYIVKSLQDIKEELDEVKEEVEDVDRLVKSHHPEEAGFITWELLKRAALLVVVLVVAWSAVATSITNNHVTDQSDDLKRTQQQQIELQEFVARMSTCNQEFLAGTIRALNQRQSSVQARADANLALQKEQAAFFSLLLGQPPKSESVRRNAAEKYLDALTHFVEQSNRTERQNDSFPYPTNEGLTDCINERKSQ